MSSKENQLEFTWLSDESIKAKNLVYWHNYYLSMKTNTKITEFASVHGSSKDNELWHNLFWPIHSALYIINGVRERNPEKC